MKSTILKRTLLVAAFAAVSFGLVSGAFAQIEAATVRVDGLGCPFCVKGVEKHLKKVDGVKAVSTSLKQGKVRLQFAPGASFELSRIEKAVVRGGFTPGVVEVTARGQVVQKEKDFVFNVIGTKTAFLLHQTDSVERQEKIAAVTGETKTKLEVAIAANQTLEITGKVHSHKDALPRLSIDTLKKVGGE